MLTRRQALAGLGASVAVAGCSKIAARVRKRAEPVAFDLPAGPTEPSVRLFGRAGFGHRPGDLALYEKDGHDAVVERLLAADQDEDPALTMQIFRLEIFRTNAIDQQEILTENEAMAQLQQAALLRAVYGANPLQERMADFWTNHFCIYGRKGPAKFRKGKDEMEVVRKNALGKFPDMLRTSAHSPAMLGFLDAQANRKGTANENYARELLELHTLGVDGGYTQRDIQEIARCFTGWTIEEAFLRRKGVFKFDPAIHDDGPKEFLGHRIPAGGGVTDGEKVLEIVSTHPSTGRYLAKKLSIYFLGERNPEVEAQISSAFEATGGDIKAMLRPLLRKEALMAGKPILKRPLDLVASSLRAVDATTDGGRPLHGHLAAMGQPLYEWPMPDGFPTDTQSWSGAMLPRWNYAFALGSGAIGGTAVDLKDITAQRLFGALFGRYPKPDEERLVRAMAEKSPAEATALAVASPAYQWR